MLALVAASFQVLLVCLHPLAVSLGILPCSVRAHCLCQTHSQQGRKGCVCAGWKESQKIFTDALADLIMAGSSASKATESDAHLHQPAGARRMLATPQHRDPSYQATQSASSTIQLSLSKASGHSTAGTIHGLGSIFNTLNVAESARLAEHPHLPSIAQDSVADDAARVDSVQQGSRSDTCPADAVSTVCGDSDQPVLAPQPWEKTDQVGAHGLRLQQCQLLNASVCEPSVQMSKEGRGFMVAVYNALAWNRASEPIRVPLDVSVASAATWLVTGQCQFLLNSQKPDHSSKNRDDDMVLAARALMNMNHEGSGDADNEMRNTFRHNMLNIICII